MWFRKGLRYRYFGRFWYLLSLKYRLLLISVTAVVMYFYGAQILFRLRIGVLILFIALIYSVIHYGPMAIGLTSQGLRFTDVEPPGWFNVVDLISKPIRISQGVCSILYDFIIEVIGSRRGK